MGNLIKYGKYWIPVGIAVTGVLWFNRPGDRRILGEDPAALYEAVQDCYVVAYLTGTQQPNWDLDIPAYSKINGAPWRTNSIDSRIQYADILDIGSKSRIMWTQSGTILWTTNIITGDTYQPALRNGSYNLIKSVGQLVDANNGSGGWNITNYNYHLECSDHTNTFTDVMTTTSTRINTNYTPYIITDKFGASLALSRTNCPVSGSVFDYATAYTLQGRTSYNSWPFATAYQYPWEQWSYPGRSRIACVSAYSDNVAWTNVAWATTNNFPLVFTPLHTNANGGGYAYSTFSSVIGDKSIPFAFIKKPTSANYLYSLPVYTHVYNVLWASSFEEYPGYPMFQNFDRIGPAAYQPITVENVVDAKDRNGNSMVTWAYRNEFEGGAIAYQLINNSTQSCSGITITKFSMLNVSNVAPVYVAVNVYTNPVPPLTNKYFQISALLQTANATGNAKSNALVTGFYATDDKRMSTNKLNGLAQIITNLHTTVYFGDYTSLVGTQVVSYFETPDILTNFVNESESGSSLPITYYDFGNPNQYITPWVGTLQQTGAYTNINYFRQLYYIDIGYKAEKIGGALSGGSWTSYSSIYGEAVHENKFAYRGITPVYPSLYALTNGYVKSVKIYVFAENYVNDVVGYYKNSFNQGYNHDVGGNYWTTKNVGTVVSNLNLNVPTMAVDDTRVKGLFRDYDLEFSNTAIFSKIYETNNPAGPISFDFTPAVVRPDLSARYAYTFTTDNGLYSYYTDDYSWDFAINLEVRIYKVMIVVDWNWQHLGNGFTPVTNNPAWRQ